MSKYLLESTNLSKINSKTSVQGIIQKLKT